MKSRVYQIILVTGGLLLIWLAALGTGTAQEPDENEDIIARGSYLSLIAGCVDCHTPRKAQYQDVSALSLEDAKTYALFSRQTKDETMLMAGGEVFNLGPRGTVTSRNLTPHEETGLGLWTDEEIKRAFRQNVDIHGHNLFPLMPAHIYNNMADDDADAIVAYLRSLPPIENAIPIFAEHRTWPSQGLPEPGFGPTAPDPSDTAAYGEYLMNGVLICADCHTPVDPETGLLVRELSFAGGQPFEGSWGIVYGGNITPHEGTGTGSWTEEDLQRAIQLGVRPDGRRLILMPWDYFATMTNQDVAAVTHYIKNEMAPINREVPGAALEEGFEEFVETGAAQAPEDEDNSNIIIIAVVVAAVVLLGGGFVLLRRRRSTIGSVKSD